MQYNAALEKLLSLAFFHKIKMGLANAEKIAKELGDPQCAYPIIHVAGTNGKGSVCTKIAKTLSLSGYKVGLYTSPHLLTVRERIQINGTYIAEPELADLVEHLLSLGQMTFFEMLTFAAFLHFKNKEVDIAVLETGLGGRLDTTNIVRPILSVITSISKDHTAILGETLEEIAAEKAGIIKSGVPVIVGPSARYSSILQTKSPLYFVPKAGSIREENEHIAKTALKTLSLPPEAIEEGIEKMPKGRLEQIGKITLDVAHNPAAIANLLNETTGGTFLVGLMKDKDIESCLSLLFNRAKMIYFTQIPMPRAASIDELASIAEKLGYQNYTKVPLQDVATLFKEPLIICGSVFLIGEIKKLLSPQEPIDSIHVSEVVMG